MTRISPTSPRRVLFLDTNVLHYSRLYLQFATDNGLSPNTTTKSDAQREVKKQYKGRTQQSIMSGLETIYYLRSECAKGARVEYSPITRLELVCCLLRGQAILDAAIGGIPGRMWNRVSEAEIFAHLQPEVYRRVQVYADEVEHKFSDVGIDLTETNPHDMRDIWTLAKSLLGIVFIEVQDCIIYASALVAMADELLTNDGYIRDIVGSIESPGSFLPADKAHFTQAQRQVKRSLARIIRGTVSDVHLPIAKKM